MSKPREMSKSEDWVAVFRSTSEMDILALEDALKERDIASVRLDQRDRMYPMLGEVQLLVAKEDLEPAIQVIEMLFVNENSR